MRLKQHVLTAALVAFLTGCNGAAVQPDTPPVEEKPFDGLKIRETREETLWINHHQGWFTGGFSPTNKLSLCLLATDNAVPIFTDGGKCLSQSISGFSYEQGYIYKLRVKKIIYDTTGVADASSYAYQLISVEEKNPATPGEPFEIIIRYSPSLLIDNNSVYINYAYKINCLPGVCDLIADGLAQTNSQGVAVNAEFGTDLTEPYVITGLKTVLISQPH